MIALNFLPSYNLNILPWYICNNFVFHIKEFCKIQNCLTSVVTIFYSYLYFHLSKWFLVDTVVKIYLEIWNKILYKDKFAEFYIIQLNVLLLWLMFLSISAWTKLLWQNTTGSNLPLFLLKRTIPFLWNKRKKNRA